MEDGAGTCSAPGAAAAVGEEGGTTTSASVAPDHDGLFPLSPVFYPPFHLPSSPSLGLPSELFSPASLLSPSYPAWPIDTYGPAAADATATSTRSTSSTEAEPLPCAAALPATRRAKRSGEQPMRGGLPQPSQQRQRLKLQHQSMDARRRQRETAVLHHLQRLLWMGEGEGVAPVAVGEGEQGEDAVKVSGRRRLKTDKLTILESSAQRMAEMQAALQWLSEQCQAKDRRIAQLTQSALGSAGSSSSPTAPLSPLTSSLLCHLDGSASLHAMRRVRSPLCLLLFSIPDGRLLDVNSALLDNSGWTRDDLVNTVVASDPQQPPPLDGSRLCPLTLKIERTESGEEAGRRQAAQQYPSTKTAMHELWAGQQRKVEVAWRIFKADGGLYETRQSVWLQQQLTEEEQQRDAAAGLVTAIVAHQMLMACALEDALRVS